MSSSSIGDAHTGLTLANVHTCLDRNGKLLLTCQVFTFAHDMSQLTLQVIMLYFTKAHISLNRNGTLQLTGQEFTLAHGRKVSQA